MTSLSLFAGRTVLSFILRIKTTRVDPDQLTSSGNVLNKMRHPSCVNQSNTSKFTNLLQDIAFQVETGLLPRGLIAS